MYKNYNQVIHLFISQIVIEMAPVKKDRRSIEGYGPGYYQYEQSSKVFYNLFVNEMYKLLVLTLYRHLQTLCWRYYCKTKIVCLRYTSRQPQMCLTVGLSDSGIALDGFVWGVTIISLRWVKLYIYLLQMCLIRFISLLDRFDFRNFVFFLAL